MKKIIRFIIIPLCIILAFIVSVNVYNSIYHKKYNVHIHYGDLENNTLTIIRERGETISSNDLMFSQALANNYHLDGWFLDQEYKTEFESLKIESNLDIFAKITKYASADDYSFTTIEKKKIIDIFKKNGEYVNLKTATGLDMIEAMSAGNFYRMKFNYKDADDYSIEYLYFPDKNLIRATMAQISQSTMGIPSGDYLFYYNYSGTLEFTLGQKLKDAKLYGNYEQWTFDIHSGEDKAHYTAKVDFVINKIIPTNHSLGDLNTCKYNCIITDASNYYMAQKHFDEKDVSSTCYVLAKSLFHFVEGVFKKFDSSFELIHK